MILDIHPDFLKSTNTGKLLETTLHEKDVDVRNLLIQDPYEPAYTIAWRRKCRSEWNMDSQTFIPLETMKIMNEPVVLVHIDSLQFVHHVKNNTMNSYIDRIQKSCQNRQIILMIEGLDNYYKKKKLLQRRQFDSQVRQTMSQNPIKKRNNRNNEDLINGPEPAMVEECINYLQLVRHVMFVLTKDDKDSARWIESLTIDLGLGRYKSKNINNSYRVERSAFQARDRKVNRVMSKKIYTIFNSDDPEQIIY
ncbi:uncharacterized protein BX663DRAFT_533796 [Cokeromyces recurvatus]|uniref:uncharacterized protein n=1 Tax=Cokeromyces recurvatus TaxID=90255 RepID=UPI00221FF09A|nr:uncharacterized protein BX663DRAFT_533796 [Cokeromyces recurvatus]KAI7897531.1 hypothetical protein BX663DRAFT_533796 [Cokeromyces recurvatus]